jgi:ribose transport system substrate-binding protein
MLFHRTRLALTTIIALSTLAACNSGLKEQTDSERVGKKLQIAVIPKGTTHSFWKSIHAGAEKAAQELDIDVLWEELPEEDDRQVQIRSVQNFVNQGVNGIVLAPVDHQALVTPVYEAIKRDIPVVIIDSELDSNDFSSFVATDNKLGGRLCGKRLAELLQGKGKVLMLHCSENATSTLAREKGFMEAIKEYGPAIELVSTHQYTGVTLEKAFQNSQQLLKQFSTVNGIFTPTELTTQGMLKALQAAGQTKQVKFVGFDINPTLLTGLQNNEIHGLAVQNPFKIGYESVKTVVAVIKKQPFDKRIDTGVMLVTAENMDDPQTKELLNPDLKKWLGE